MSVWSCRLPAFLLPHLAQKPRTCSLYMPQLSHEVNHFNKIHIVNLYMNQSIRKFLSSGFVTCPGYQNHLLPKVRPILDCWSIPSLFGNGGVDGHLKKSSKNGYLSVRRASFTCSSWNRPAIKISWLGEVVVARSGLCGSPRLVSYSARQNMVFWKKITNTDFRARQSAFAGL